PLSNILYVFISIFIFSFFLFRCFFFFFFLFFFFFFFNDTATTEIYTLSLHDALPIFFLFDFVAWADSPSRPAFAARTPARGLLGDRKSTRLNSSHGSISYAVFCLKKKKKKKSD